MTTSQEARVPLRMRFTPDPQDDTHALVVSLATGQRLTLLVVPADEAADSDQWDDDGQPWRI